MKKEVHQRFRGLDFLRLFAAAGIVFFHTAGGSFLIANQLYLFVDLFFLLSGFVLEPMFPRRTDKKNLFRFVALRYIRLAPMVYSTIIFQILYQLAIFIKYSSKPESQETFLPLNLETVVLSLLMLQILSQQALLLNFPMWSLSAEWIVNLLLAPTLSSVHRKIVACLFIVAAITPQILSFYVDLPEFWIQMSRALMGITCGVLLRTFFEKEIHVGVVLRTIALMGVLLIVLLLFAKIDTMFLPILMVLPFSCLIHLVALLEKRKKLKLNEKYSLLAGSLSFGIYVWHIPLSGIADKLTPNTESGAPILGFVVLLTISGIVSFFISKYVEKPTQAYLKRQVVSKLR